MFLIYFSKVENFSWWVEKNEEIGVLTMGFRKFTFVDFNMDVQTLEHVAIQEPIKVYIL